MRWNCTISKSRIMPDVYSYTASMPKIEMWLNAYHWNDDAHTFLTQERTPYSIKKVRVYSDPDNPLQYKVEDIKDNDNPR